MGPSASIHASVRPAEQNTPMFNVTTFLKSAKEGQLDRLLSSLNLKGSDVNVTNKLSLTALHLAAKEGHLEVVSTLLDHRADPNITTRRGNTALHIAAVHGQRAVCRKLLQRGARVNAACKHGYTPLYLAVMENQRDIVQDLLTAGADRSIGPNQVTPLKIAEVQQFTDIISLLKENRWTMTPAISLTTTEDIDSLDSQF